MTNASLPPESRQHLNYPAGTVAFTYHLTTPLRAAPANVAQTFLEEIAVNGTIFRIVAGPGYTWRFVRERDGEAKEAVANLAPLGGSRSLLIVLRWTEDDEVALDISMRERAGAVVAKGRSSGYVET